jgi:hypothetical protein
MGLSKESKLAIISLYPIFLFVDDILPFCDGSRKDALKLRELLYLYYKAKVC